jgi:hypothetical protein
MSKIVMEKGRVKLRTAEAKDIKSMIVLLGELERPYPKTSTKIASFKNLSTVISSLTPIMAISVSF